MIHVRVTHKLVCAYVHIDDQRYLGCIISLRAHRRFEFHGSASIESVSPAKTISQLFSIIRSSEDRDPMICSSL